MTLQHKMYGSILSGFGCVAETVQDDLITMRNSMKWVWARVNTTELSNLYKYQ